MLFFYYLILFTSRWKCLIDGQTGIRKLWIFISGSKIKIKSTIGGIDTDIKHVWLLWFGIPSSNSIKPLFRKNVLEPKLLENLYKLRILYPFVLPKSKKLWFAKHLSFMNENFLIKVISTVHLVSLNKVMLNRKTKLFYCSFSWKLVSFIFIEMKAVFILIHLAQFNKYFFIDIKIMNSNFKAENE